MGEKTINVLYVGHTLVGDADATGNTLYQIFHDIKGIRFMQYCLDYDPKHHTNTFETVYISPKKSKLYFQIKKYYRNDSNSTVNELVTGDAERKGNAFIAVAKAIMDSLHKEMGEESLKKIDDFKPQVIYTLGENITTLKHAIMLSNRYRVPIVLHVMDDFEPTIYGYTKLTYLWRKRYISLLNVAYSRSVTNFAISDKMAKEYEKRHRTPFDFAMNCLDELHPQPIPNNEPLRMVFSGGLHGGRAASIAKIADIIKNDNVLRENLTLTVHTSQVNIELYGDLLKDKVDLQSYVPKEDMYANLGKADILLHVESFQPEEISYYRLSMSTKIPECMSVGRPVFCYGPLDICTVSYIKDRGFGLVAENEHEVLNSLHALIDDRNLRLELGKRALEIAKKEHLKTSVQQRVYDVFCESVGTSR